MIDWLFKKLNIKFTNTPYEWVVSFLALGVIPILAMCLAYFLPENILDKLPFLASVSNILVELVPSYNLIWQYSDYPQICLFGIIFLWIFFPLQIYFSWLCWLEKRVKKNGLWNYFKGYFAIFLIFFVVFSTAFLTKELPVVASSMDVFSIFYLKIFLIKYYTLFFYFMVGHVFSFLFTSFLIITLSLIDDVKSKSL